MFFEDPHCRQRSAQQTSVPAKPCATEEKRNGVPYKAVPFFEDEKEPGANQSSDHSRSHDAAGQLRIVTVALKLQANDPARHYGAKSPEDAQTVDGQRADLKKNGIHTNARSFFMMHFAMGHRSG
jgi:hypothetical protein